MTGLETDTIVGDRNARHGPVLANLDTALDGDGGLDAGAAELQGVGDQVEEKLVHLARIGLDRPAGKRSSSN